MSKLIPAILAATILGMVADKPEQIIQIRHKEIVKRQKSVRVTKPGRGKNAKNYDPITHTWIHD